MTTLGEVLTPGSEPAVAGRARVWPRVLAAFAAGLLLTVGLVAGALLAWDSTYDGRVLPGVSVGAVDLSGRDREEAAAVLEEAFAGFGEGRVLIRTAVGAVSVMYRSFARMPDVPAMVDAAMGAGRACTMLERAVAEVRQAMSGVSLEPRLSFDEAALRAEVDAAVARLERAPIDSRVWMYRGTVHLTPSRSGRSLDGAVAAEAALASVGRVDAPPEIAVMAPMTVIPPKHDDRAAMAEKDAAERVIGDVVVTLGSREWTIKAKTVKTWVALQVAADGSAKPVADQAMIAKSLKKIAKAVQRDPVSAIYLKTRGGRVVGVVAARDGRELDTATTAARIAEALEGRAQGGPPDPVKAKTTKIEPKRTTAQALQKGPLMERLGSWKTPFAVSERNYFGANIWLPAQIIDGTVLFPGQRFEWWSALGPVTPARGFGPGGFIAGNHTEPTGALGGGMCSSSTTLFNAALRAGLQMGARANHRYYIDRYPLGLDATVSKTRNGVQTVTFTNDMDDPIVIRTFRYRSGGRAWVRYEIWGIPDGRTVSLSKPAVSNVRKATTRTVYVSTLPTGVRKQTEYPANGMDVSVTRVVRSRSGAVLHRDTYRTHYTLWNGRIEVGR
jgi:vancomycin resistance protein YoaR